MRKKLIPNTNRYYKYLIYSLGFFAAVLFILLSVQVRVAVIITIFIFFNRIITTYKLYIRLPIEIEFLTLGIVLSTLAFGIKAGLVIAILGCILSFIIGFEISTFSLPMFLGYSAVALLSYLLRTLDVTAVGIIATLGNNLIVFTLYHFLFGYDIGRNMSFSLSNIFFNSILFFNLAPLMMTLL